MLVEEHPHALDGICQGYLLGCRDDECARQTERLHQRQMDITRPWRQVDEQIVQLPPVRLCEELLEGVARHATAPEHGALLVDEEADREHAHAEALDRCDELLSVDVLEDGALVFAAEHLRLRRAEDISIQQPDLIPFLG